MFEPTTEQKTFLDAEGLVTLCACPGSGKTAIVAQKLQKYVHNWPYAHQGVAALSFTNVASEEIAEKLNDLTGNGVSVQYPHFVGTLDKFINNFVLLRFGYLITKNKKRPVIDINGIHHWKFNYWRHDCQVNGCPNNFNSFHLGIDRIYYYANKPIQCSRKENRPLPCEQYRSTLDKHGIISQNNAATYSYFLLKQYPEIAKAIVARFPVIILDEAQDTSADQIAVFEQLVEAGLKNLFLVGDPDQAIYEWRNATPKCFIEKISDPGWTGLELTNNYRSSQIICNAVQSFSSMLAGKPPNTASGEARVFNTKPILIEFDAVTTTEEQIISKFQWICAENAIVPGNKKIAVLSRGRIYSNTAIDGLWKSKEIENIAQAAYEWYCGSRKKARIMCEKVIFSLLYGDTGTTSENEMKEKIDNSLTMVVWDKLVLSTIIGFPAITIDLKSWMSEIVSLFSSQFEKYGVTPRTGKDISTLFKIKTRDKKHPNFMTFQTKDFFEKQNTSASFNRSTVHGVKGETYDAVLLMIKSNTGATLTPNALMKGSLDDEIMRLAYVAMTRPRKILVVAIPKVKSKRDYSRFPIENWDRITL